MTLLQSGKPVAFVYTVDRERAVAFYQGTLGLTLRSADEHGDFFDLGGGLMRLTVIPDHKPSPHPVLGWEVEDIVATATALKARGIVFSVFEGWDQDALGIWTSPDGTSKLTFFNDPDANALMLTEA